MSRCRCGRSLSVKIFRQLLEKLLVELCKAGLVTATKGRRGGYQLARPAQKFP
ncbi:Rrf2 family transcriptional regulator [Synechococcus elongatus IITB5]